MDKTFASPIEEKNHNIESIEEEIIRNRLLELADAISRGNVAEIMSFYADKVVVFDMMPPIKFASKNEFKREVKDKCFSQVFHFPVFFEFTDLDIDISGDLAVCTSLVHFSGTFKESEQKINNWIRSTIVFHKWNDDWLIEHEHNSVPIGMNGKALMDLGPHESSMH